MVIGNKAIEPTFFFQSKEAEQINAGKGLWVFAPEFVQLSIFEVDSNSVAYSIAFDLGGRKSPQLVLNCVEWAFNNAPSIGALSSFHCISFFEAPSVFPLALFDQSEQEQLFRFENTQFEDCQLLFSVHSIFSIDCVERVPDWLIHGLPQFSSSHFNWSGGMASFLESSTLESKSYLKAFIQPHCFDVFILIEGKLELCNRFHFKTVSDCIYFLMLCIQQTPLNLAIDSFELIGFHPKANEISGSLSQYIKQLHVRNFNSHFPNTLNRLIK